MKRTGLSALAAYAGCILAANWFIGHLGTTCVPNGPCLIPVWPGLLAPSGVLWVGAALFARDIVQEQLGRRWTVLGILLGAGLSYLVETPALAVASGVAFLTSEAADMLVYTPLRERGWAPQAVLASGLVGSLVDSAAFLWLAFGSLTFLAGQFVGKAEITVLCALLTWTIHQRREASSST